MQISSKIRYVYSPSGIIKFCECYNIITYSQYEEVYCMLKLLKLFHMIQNLKCVTTATGSKNWIHPLYTEHTQSQVGFPGPLAQGNEDIDQLSKANMLEDSKFHENTMLT